MKRNLTPSTSRMATIFNEMISIRRGFRADRDFFRMDEFWKDLCDDEGRWTIKIYRSNETEDFKRKAGVIAFDDRAILTVDARLMENARKGCGLSNFILAHEASHLALDHHAKCAVTKNFQLFAGPNGNANIPPTMQESETNYAAVFLQCGVALLDSKWDAVDLAHRAFTDVEMVRKARRLVQLSVFRRELFRQQSVRPREVF